MYKNKKEIDNSISLSVGIPGFEPGMTGPESVVLPLHHIPLIANSLLLFDKKVYRSFVV